MPERYFLENWVRDAKGEGEILDGKFEDLDSKHPHVTFVRPFTIPTGHEEEVKNLIVDYCKGRKPIEYKLKGKGNFPGGITYIPVESDELLEFNNGLEEILEGKVFFDEKLADEKTLHLATTLVDFEDFPETTLPMLRLTCIRDKKIWFSYDFMAGIVLNREESLHI